MSDQYADLDSNVEFRCEALGKPIPKYSWFRDGIEIKPAVKVFDRYTISKNLLTIGSVTMDDSHTIQCAAENALGSAYSTGNLKVLGKTPEFS